MEEIRELFLAIQFSAMNWVVISMLTSMLHYLKIYKLDRFICLKCFTFWSTLIFTQNILIAAVASFLSFLVDKFLLNSSTKL